jgi:hypothetical protein
MMILDVQSLSADNEVVVWARPPGLHLAAGLQFSCCGSVVCSTSVAQRTFSACACTFAMNRFFKYSLLDNEGGSI